jgi:hypothetical protein
MTIDQMLELMRQGSAIQGGASREHFFRLGFLVSGCKAEIEWKWYHECVSWIDGEYPPEWQKEELGAEKDEIGRFLALNLGYLVGRRENGTLMPGVFKAHIDALHGTVRIYTYRILESVQGSG